jgi:integrase
MVTSTRASASPNYTVRRAAEDWLAEGLDGRSAKTIKKNQNVLAPILTAIGARRLRELTADDVRQALTAMAARYSTAAVAMGHNALTRAIRYAEARDLVGRNVATLVDTPKGQAGRPGQSLTMDQASALLAAAEGTRMDACIALCLATGIRPEEARALRRESVDFGDPDAQPPAPASAAVWRSVRSHGDTKTEKHAVLRDLQARATTLGTDADVRA